MSSELSCLYNSSLSLVFSVLRNTCLPEAKAGLCCCQNLYSESKFQVWTRSPCSCGFLLSPSYWISSLAVCCLSSQSQFCCHSKPHPVQSRSHKEVSFCHFHQNPLGAAFRPESLNWKQWRWRLSYYSNKVWCFQRHENQLVVWAADRQTPERSFQTEAMVILL